jgi:outer membrane protein TolC
MFRQRGFVNGLLGGLLVPLVASAQATPARPAPAHTPVIDVPDAPAAAALGKDGPLLETLTFDVAVKRALDRNPTSLEAAAEIRRSHALMEEVRAGSLPTLNGTAIYTRLDADRVAGGTVVATESGINLSAVASVPLINPRGWVAWSQAGDQVDVARLNAADVRRTLAVATARAYLGVIAQRRLHETAVTARDNAKAHYGFTRAQLQGGVGNRLDEIRAAQELTTDEVLLQNQEVALFRAREALGVLVAGDGLVDVAEWAFGKMPRFERGDRRGAVDPRGRPCAPRGRAGRGPNGARRLRRLPPHPRLDRVPLLPKPRGAHDPADRVGGRARVDAPPL